MLPERVDDPTLALELLLADDLNVAGPLAARLTELNKQRQADTRRVIDEANQRIASSGGIEAFPALVLADPTWSIGIAGLVAGRLAEAHGRPTVVLEQGETESRGSARTAGNVDIFAALRQSQSLLTRYGGHQAAAGLSLKNSNVEQLRHELAATVLDMCGGRPPVRTIAPDALAEHDDLDLYSVELFGPSRTIWAWKSSATVARG